MKKLKIFVSISVMIIIGFVTPKGFSQSVVLKALDSASDRKALSEVTQFAAAANQGSSARK